VRSAEMAGMEAGRGRDMVKWISRSGAPYWTYLGTGQNSSLFPLNVLCALEVFSAQMPGSPLQS
jgi:hypothetical protein